MEQQSLYLAHHGIKGQKWGVRRFQNKDGTLTPEGMKRYRELVTPDGNYTQKALNEHFDKRVERGVTDYIFGRRINDPFVAQVIRENKSTIDASIAQTRAMQIAEINRQQNEIAIREANRTASLGLSGGMNPFMFG